LLSEFDINCPKKSVLLAIFPYAAQRPILVGYPATIEAKLFLEIGTVCVVFFWLSYLKYFEFYEGTWNIATLLYPKLV
jgi:hypothetical protein